MIRLKNTLFYNTEVSNNLKIFGLLRYMVMGNNVTLRVDNSTSKLM